MYVRIFIIQGSVVVDGSNFFLFLFFFFWSLFCLSHYFFFLNGWLFVVFFIYFSIFSITSFAAAYLNALKSAWGLD